MIFLFCICDGGRFIADPWAQACKARSRKLMALLFEREPLGLRAAIRMEYG